MPMSANDRRNSHRICAAAETMAMEIEEKSYPRPPMPNYPLVMLVRSTASHLHYTWEKYWHKHDDNNPPHIAKRMHKMALAIDGEAPDGLPSDRDLVEILRDAVSMVRKIDEDEESRDSKGRIIREKIR